MDDVTANWLAKRIQIISDEIRRTGWDVNKLTDNFKFENRQLSHSKECLPFYESGKFCHNNGDGSERYCLLCSCNHYNNSKKEGGCNIGDPCDKGYYLDRSMTPFDSEGNKLSKEIWDCSNCLYPHTRIATQRFLGNLKRKSVKGKIIEEILEEILVK